MASQGASPPRARDGRRWPTDLACGPAFLVPLVACVLVGGRVPMPAEVAVLALVVAVAGYVAAAPAGLLAVACSVLSFNGFRENGLGTLAVHPGIDGPVALTLLAAWAVAWATGRQRPVSTGA
jgi:hypothetical protein